MKTALRWYEACSHLTLPYAKLSNKIPLRYSSSSSTSSQNKKILRCFRAAAYIFTQQPELKFIFKILPEKEKELLSLSDSQV